mmetsp:Transcript_37753/g.77553  ORF Transcript_37753/g.77553 Transcript_37753/m.77553 type:complete len:101 (-) Transcript_37753:224-526(-)
MILWGLMESAVGWPNQQKLPVPRQNSSAAVGITAEMDSLCGQHLLFCDEKFWCWQRLEQLLPNCLTPISPTYPFMGYNISWGSTRYPRSWESTSVSSCSG